MSNRQDATDTAGQQDSSNLEEPSSAENRPRTTKDSDDAEREQDRQLETGEENPA